MKYTVEILVNHRKVMVIGHVPESSLGKTIAMMVDAEKKQYCIVTPEKESEAGK